MDTRPELRCSDNHLFRTIYVTYAPVALILRLRIKYANTHFHTHKKKKGKKRNINQKKSLYQYLLVCTICAITFSFNLFHAK